MGNCPMGDIILYGETPLMCLCVGSDTCCILLIYTIYSNHINDHLLNKVQVIDCGLVNSR